MLRSQREIKRLEARIAKHDGVAVAKHAEWVRKHPGLELPEFLAVVDPLISDVCARKAAEYALQRMLEINIAVSNETMSVGEGLRQAASVDVAVIYLQNRAEWTKELQDYLAESWRKARSADSPGTRRLTLV